MKKCSKCKNCKDFSEFFKNKAQKDGYSNLCKICDKARKPVSNEFKSTIPEILALDETTIEERTRRESWQANRLARRVTSIRKSATKRDIEFSLSALDTATLCISPCVYCGRESEHKTDKLSRNPYNGVDRVDSGRGYTSDNVQSCCTMCNRMKLDHSHTDFLDHIKRIVQHVRI